MEINFKVIRTTENTAKCNKLKHGCFRVKLILIKSLNTQINPTAMQGQNKAVAKIITKILILSHFIAKILI